VSHERWVAALVLALAAWLCFGALGARSLENKDITRTAEIARETVQTGRWLAPTREGELETEKPPLYIWLVAGLGMATGRIGALESRLPAAAASYLSVLLIFFWVRSRLGTRPATVAAAFLALGQIFLELARLSRVDSTFALLLAVAAILSYEAQGRAVGKQLLLSALSGAALAGAMLAKSPLLAVVLHLAATGGFYIVDLGLSRPWERLEEPAPLNILRRYLAPPASLPPILAGCLFALWFFPFKGALSPVEWEAVKHQFIFENIERGSSGADKPQPFWFYVPGVLFRSAPGSLFALLSYALVKDEREGERPVLRFAQAWWFFPFLVLSIASGKQARYLLPVLPGLAVAGALGFERFARSTEPWAARARLALAWTLGIAGALAALVLPIVASRLLPDVLGDACFYSVLCAVIALLGFTAVKDGSFLPALLLAFFVGESAFNVSVLPSPTIDRRRSIVKRLSEKLPQDLRLDDLVILQPPASQGETRQRRLRILLSLYRDELAFARMTSDAKTFLDELSASPGRRGLVDGETWAETAPIASSLSVEHDWTLEAEKGSERFRLVRRSN